MNKIALITVISISTLLTGCGTTQTTHQNTTTPTITKAVETPNPVATTITSLTVDTKKQPYSITTETFSQDKIKIQYPQIKGLEDNSKEKAINDLIKNDVLNSQVEVPIKLYQDATKLTLDLKYQVTMNTTELLSVVYTGYANIEGSAFPTNNIYAITIDMKNVTKLKLSDFTTIDTNLVLKIKQLTSNTNNAVKNGINKEDLDVLIKDKPDQYFIDGLKNQWAYYTFYVTPNSLGISIATIHAAGDYALIEIPDNHTKSIKDDIGKENKVSADNQTGISEVNENLCGKDEELVFSLKIKDSSKRLSICMSKNKDYLLYRFGTKEKVELEFPQSKEGSWNKFTYMYYFSPAGPGSGLDLKYLKFENGGYTYIVYDELAAMQNSKGVGVMVYDKASKRDAANNNYRYFVFEPQYKELVIEGDEKSVIGDLGIFRFNDKIKVEGL